MNNRQYLALVKSVHTLIWIFYNCVVIYMLYASITNKMDRWFWICGGFILLEGIILLLFKLTCPLTLIARQYSDSQKDNFDIYLPEWLARNTKRIYSLVVFVIILIAVFQLLK